MPIELWLVRHGETEWSLAGRHTSSTDLPLIESGRAAAMRVGARLHGIEFSRVLTSPLVRARETAGLAGFSTAEICDDLHEWRYGQDEGRTTPEIREERPGWSIWTHGPLGGESREDASARADRFVASIRGVNGRVLAFSHAHISRILAVRWIGLPLVKASHLPLATASVSVLGWERDIPAIRLWNDAGRLPS